MVGLRGNSDEEKESQNVGGSFVGPAPFATRRDARELAHHYILTPIGKPENATASEHEQDTNGTEPTIGTTPLIVMPPGPVIIDPHEQHEDSGGDEEKDSGKEEKAKMYDHDSGEDKVAAMIEEMQKKAFDGGDPALEAPEEGEEDLEDDMEEEGTTQDTQEDGGEEDGAGGGEEDGVSDENSAIDDKAIEDLPESDNETIDQEEGSFEDDADSVDSMDIEDNSDVGDPLDDMDSTGNEDDEAIDAIDQDTQEDETNEEMEPIQKDDGDLPTETPANTELPGSDKNSDGGEAKSIDVDGGEDDNGEESEPVDDEDLPSETPSDAIDDDTQDTEPDNDGGSDGEGDGEEQVDDENENNTEEKGSEQETPETKNNEDSDGNGQEQDKDAPGDDAEAKEETENDKDTSEALETMAPTDKQVTESPSPAPTAMATEEKVVVTFSPTKAPVQDDSSASPSRTAPDINNNDHDDASEAKSREKQPHTATPIGPDDGGPTFGALCRHPSGVIQGANCKVIVGFQSHPLAYSGALLLLCIWGCCFCKRVCKGRARREADHGEYRAVAAQYDDVLFSDTFDDNYSASFADGRSDDGSIESEEEDDWTKGPNIEMGAISHKEDDLTLEEMNG